MRTGCQICHAVDNIYVGFITDTDPAGKSQAEAVQITEHLGDETAALGGQSDESRSSFKRQKCHIEFMMGIGDPQAVRTQKSDAVSFGHCDQLFLEFHPFSADLIKSPGYHDGMFNSFAAAFFHDRRHNPAGQYHNCQIGYFR